MAFRFASIARRSFTRNYSSATSKQAGKAFPEESMIVIYDSIVRILALTHIPVIRL